MNHILTATQLAKRYGKRDVVKGVSLRLQSGEIVGLLGPNGAGKTTSFYMLVGLVPCDQGSVHLNQINISKLPIHARARIGIGYLPQEASVFRGLSVEENIMAVLELRPELSKAERLHQLDALLDEFNVNHIRTQPGISLSGGERRRVEIARALASEPKFILLDEPFAGIDPISVVDIKNIINQLKQRQLGILITDHNVRETLNICDNAYIMNNGELICHGSAETVLANQQVRDVYLGKEFNL